MNNSFKMNIDSDSKYMLKEDLVDYIKQTTNYEKDSSIRWVLHDLEKEGKITKIDSRYFYKGVLLEYIPKNETKRKKQIKKIINSKYPKLDIIIYESKMLNEWLNHQIARNVIFVEVEKYFVEDVFVTLKDKVKKTVLFKPSRDEFYLYAEDDMIVVSNLITRSPKNRNSCEIKIEKLIVDIFSNNLISEFVADSEYNSIIDSIFNSYKVNTKKVITYAKRRNIENIVRKYIDKYEPSKII